MYTELSRDNSCEKVAEWEIDGTGDDVTYSCTEHLGEMIPEWVREIRRINGFAPGKTEHCCFLASFPSWKEKLAIAHEFYHAICQRAETKMEMTGHLEGAHYAAMQEILKEWESLARIRASNPSVGAQMDE